MGQPLLISTAQCAQPVDGPEHLPIYAPDPRRAAYAPGRAAAGVTPAELRVSL